LDSQRWLVAFAPFDAVRSLVANCWNDDLRHVAGMAIGLLDDAGRESFAITRLRNPEISVAQTDGDPLPTLSHDTIGDPGIHLAAPRRSGSRVTKTQQRLGRAGGRLVTHVWCYWLLLAESHLTRRCSRAWLVESRRYRCRPAG
jgi:hypothetical protein